MRIFTFRTTILVTLLLIVGCSTKPNLDYSSKIPVDHVVNLDHWIASGKILIVENGEKQSANFYWQQKGENYTFSLSTFLGIDIFSLEYKGDLAVINTNGESYAGNDAKELLYSLTGHNIPVENMQAWLLGFANSHNAINKSFDNENRLRSFDFVSANKGPDQFSVPQLARTWAVRYQSRVQTQKFALPKLISIRSEATRIKLSIAKWQY